ncbi:MAG: hypothetical protein V1799_07320 [bacterium]
MARLDKILLILVSVCSLIFLESCKDEIADPNTDPIVFPENNISYSKHVQPLFQQRCALPACHSGSNAARDLDLTTPSYSQLLNHQPRLVTSNAAANSLLVQRLEGTIPPRMPLNSTSLNTNQLNGIKKWIQEGALNN